MTRSVTKILTTKYAIAGTPGEKTRCPKCRHDTLQIQRQDAVAKCFRPSCGWYITAAREGAGDRMASILEDFFNACHRELVAGTRASKRALEYCLAERRIARSVIESSNVGVVPAAFDFDGLFQPYLRAAREELDQERQRGDRKKGKSLAEIRLEAIEAARKKLGDAAQSGWLAFFYTDAEHRFVAVRFRNPSKKEFTYFGQGAAGVFGLPLLSQEELKTKRAVVVEGEFNQLRLLSLASGDPGGVPFDFVCAVGSAHMVDAVTLRRCTEMPTICYDNDPSGAGLAVVEAVNRQMGVDVVTTPAGTNDLDDFIERAGSDAAPRVRQLFAAVTRRYRPFAAVREELDAIRQSEGGKDGRKRFEVINDVATVMIHDLLQRGKFYTDKQTGYVLLREDGTVAPIAADDFALDSLLSEYGVGPGQDIYKPIRELLRMHALKRGELTTVYPFAHWNRETATLYVFDLDRTVFKITKQGVEEVANGTDGVLFLKNQKWQRFRYLRGETATADLFDEIVVGSINFAKSTFDRVEVLLLLRIWFYALFFPELFPTRPILAFIGEKGSGKSSILRRIGKALFGPEFNVSQLSEDPKDFDAIVTHDAFVALDNVDTCSKWLEDRLAVSATGGRVTKRELHTTNRLVSFPIRAFLGITSRTPHFRREDVADRLLPIHVDRYDSFRPEADLLDALLSNRDQFMTSIIDELREVVQIISEAKTSTTGEKLRMADFVDFALKVSEGRGSGDGMRRILEKISSEQATFALEADPLVELLEDWMELNDGENIARLVSTKQLGKELGDLAQSRGQRYEYLGHTQGLGQRLTNLMSTLHERFDVHDERRRSRSRVLGFRPKGSDTIWHQWTAKHEAVALMARSPYPDRMQ